MLEYIGIVRMLDGDTGKCRICCQDTYKYVKLQLDVNDVETMFYSLQSICNFRYFKFSSDDGYVFKASKLEDSI